MSVETVLCLVQLSLRERIWQLRCLNPRMRDNVCRNGIMSSMRKSPRKNMAPALFESADE